MQKEEEAKARTPTNKEEDLKKEISRVVVEKLQTVLIENDLRLREGPSGRRADEGGGVFGVDGSRSGGGGEREVFE